MLQLEAERLKKIPPHKGYKEIRGNRSGSVRKLD